MNPVTVVPSRAQLPDLKTIEVNIATLKTLLQESHSQFTILLQHISPDPTKKMIEWHDMLPQLETIDANISDYWAPIDHLQSVDQKESNRQLYQEGIELITQWNVELTQNIQLYQWIKQIKNHPDFHQLEQPQKKIIENTLHTFRLAGIGLALPEQKRYQHIQIKLAKASAQFESNIVDSSRETVLQVKDSNRLKGLPKRAITAAAQAAQQTGQEGWLFTLDFPNVQTIMENAEDRSLRKEFYQAWVTRASESTAFDNSQLMYDILKKRHELSQLTGFDNYAERSLADGKMAPTPQAVITFLHQLLKASIPAAKREIEALQQFAAPSVNELAEWDIGYFSSKLEEEKFGIQQEKLRAYFPLPHVLKELFKILNELFGLHISIIPSARVWDPIVQVIEIKDHAYQVQGYLYLDLYTRNNKRSGAWVNPYRQRRLDSIQQLHLPFCFLTCNFSPPLANEPALLTHDDIVTLFHEMGHALHHTLTQINYASVSGMAGVAWDAVEFPSQLLEAFSWQPAVLARLGCHYQTGEKLPSTTIYHLYESYRFQAGLRLLRQLEFSLFDFKLHQTFNPQQGPDQIQHILDDIRQSTRIIPVAPFDRFQHSFAHIFSGGYAAGYYSYLWAEVLAADALERFIEEGLQAGILNFETGQDFITNVLALGGSVDMMTLFKRFRGREPDTKALLRQRRIVE